jgi:hypothetical protein
MTIQQTPSLISNPKVSNTPFTSSINTDTKFSFDEKHKITTYNEDFSVSKLANVAAQALNNQVNKTQDLITQPDKPSASGPVGSSSPNDKLIAGKILAEARAASKGMSPTVNNINIATSAINELGKLKESSEIYQKASQTEKDGKVTDNISTLIEGGQKVAQGVIDLMTPLLKGSPGVSISGNDTVNLGANRGISINTRGSITSVSPEHNVHTSLNVTTSEVSVEKVGLKSQESETRINSTTNNIDRSTNNVQLHSSLETVSNNSTHYSKDLIQTVTSNKLDSFARGETQGADMKFSMDKTMLYTIGETFTLGVGDAPSNQEKKPGFNVSDLLDNTLGSPNTGSLLTISPSTYSLQQKGKVSIQSSGTQSHIANKIANIATEKVVNMSKQDVLSVAMGSEFRIGASTGFSTFGGFGSTVLGNFNIIGNLMGFISGISEIAGLVFPDLELPSELNIPSRSEKVSLEGKIKFDECLPKGLNKGKTTSSSNPTNPTSTTIDIPPPTDGSVIQGSELNDLPEYKDQEILDKLQEVYPEAGGLQLNKPKGKDKVEAITPETDTPLGIKSSPQTSDPLQQPSTPHNTTIKTTEEDNNTTTPNNSSVILDKKSNANPQQSNSKSPSSNTVTNSIKARYTPHTYIDIYREEDYFPDLKSSTNNNPSKNTNTQTPNNSVPSIKDYIEKSTTLNDEQKQKISNNLKAINEALSEESSTSNLTLALSNKVKGLDESEIKEIVDSYLELNASLAVGFGFLGDITAFFKEVTSVVTEVYEQVDKAASVFGLDIKGGPISSVMDIVNKVKTASDSSSISGLLSTLGSNFDEFMPITTSILGLLDGTKTKDDLISSLSSSVSGLISPLLKGTGSSSIITDTLLEAVSDVITNGTVMNRDKGDILNRVISLLSSQNIIPSKAFDIANGLGNVIDGIQNGSLLPSLLGSGVNTLFSTLNSAIDMGPINKILGNINSIYGTIESFMAIPSMLEAMNDYDIPLLSQVSSILNCVDVYSRLKDIVGIVKDPLGYEPQHTESSLNLPTDLSINKLKNELSERILGKDSPITEAIASGGELSDFLSSVTSKSGGIDSLINQVSGSNPFFLLPEGNKAYLNSGEVVDSGQFLVNSKGDVLITDKDSICRMENISLISNTEVIALDLPSLNKENVTSGVLSSLLTPTSSKYIPEYKTKDDIKRALQSGDLEPLGSKNKDTQASYTVGIGIKNNPQLMSELMDTSSSVHLKDSISNEEFIWSELNPTSIPGYVPSNELETDDIRVHQVPLSSSNIRGTVQHTKGSCKASISELFQMINKLQGISSSTLQITTKEEELNSDYSNIKLNQDSLLVKGQEILLSVINSIEINNKGYKLLSWNIN